MTPQIYNTLKTTLGAIIGSDGLPLFKTIMLWNSQTDHVLQNENDNYPWLTPACFIEFNNINCTNLGNKARVQQCDFDTTLHLVRDIILNEDVEILNDKLKAYQAMQTLEFGITDPTTGRFTRIGENPNYDNNLLMVYDQMYHSTYKDASATEADNIGTINTLIINQTITP